MPTSSTEIWNSILSSVPRYEWVEIATIYQAVEASIPLQEDDFLPTASGNDDPRNGLVLCANHHRAFDDGLFTFNTISPPQVILADGHSTKQLKLTVKSLVHMHKYPHRDAIQWHHEHFMIRNAK